MSGTRASCASTAVRSGEASAPLPSRLTALHGVRPYGARRGRTLSRHAEWKLCRQGVTMCVAVWSMALMQIRHTTSSAAAPPSGCRPASSSEAVVGRRRSGSRT